MLAKLTRSSFRLLGSLTNINVAKSSFSTLNKPYLTIRENNLGIKRYESTTSSNTVMIYFIDRDGVKRPAKAKIGSNLLDAALDNNIDLEGFGACEGTLSCSTCHLIFKKEDYDQLKPSTDEEEDMLDLAFGLTETSRLGCQIIVQPKMNNWVVQVPAEVSDAREV